MQAFQRRELESRIAWTCVFCFLTGLAMGALALPTVKAWPVWERVLLCVVPFGGALGLGQATRIFLANVCR